MSAGGNPISCLTFQGETEGYSENLGCLLAQHVTAYTGKDLIGGMDGTDQFEHKTSRAKRQGQECPKLTDWHKDK